MGCTALHHEDHKPVECQRLVLASPQVPLVAVRLEYIFVLLLTLQSWTGELDHQLESETSL